MIVRIAEEAITSNDNEASLPTSQKSDETTSIAVCQRQGV